MVEHDRRQVRIAGWRWRRLDDAAFFGLPRWASFGGLYRGIDHVGSVIPTGRGENRERDRHHQRRPDSGQSHSYSGRGFPEC